jgi:Asp-tRNA(Asn)/Glu-tRNA(Gln) amidotransferase A subunit family amidase
MAPHLRPVRALAAGAARTCTPCRDRRHGHRLDLDVGARLIGAVHCWPRRSQAGAGVAGHYRGVLHGVPLAVKDLFWIKDAPAAAGTTIYRDFRPGQDATAVARLRDAGAVFLGKLQMTEGAYSDHHPSITPPVNPCDAAYWTGISSSGPAVATAAGLCYAALASGTGGSIRWPCAATGLTGIKPTWGRVSRHGTFPTCRRRYRELPRRSAAWAPASWS